jgi:hypothetical protein
MNIERNKIPFFHKKGIIVLSRIIIPRSQAIYGSLVETLEPYSRDYTTYFYNIRFFD